MDVLDQELNKIDALLIDDDYSDDEPAPTAFCIGIAKAFIKVAVQTFKDDYPQATFTPDFKGGLTAIWTKGERILHLLIRPENISLFWKEGKDFRQIDIHGRRDLLISKLVWLKG